MPYFLGLHGSESKSRRSDQSLSVHSGVPATRFLNRPRLFLSALGQIDLRADNGAELRFVLGGEATVNNVRFCVDAAR